MTLDNTALATVPEEVFTGCAQLVTLSMHGCPIRQDMMEATPGYAEFFKRVQGKHSAKIHGGAMIGSKGLDDGVDHDVSRDMAGAHT